MWPESSIYCQVGTDFGLPGRAGRCGHAEILMVENPDSRAGGEGRRAKQVGEAAGVAAGSPRAGDISNNHTRLCLTQAHPLSCRML